jgi:hypothetical protein
MIRDKIKAPSERDLVAELGCTRALWDGIIIALEEKYGALDREWRPSKGSFGWICLLKHKKRTLLYLTPEKEMIRAAIVLAERAVVLALASNLPEDIKTMIREARPYAEGRGIRFPVCSTVDVSVVCDLVAFKTTPK